MSLVSFFDIDARKEEDEIVSEIEKEKKMTLALEFQIGNLSTTKQGPILGQYGVLIADFFEEVEDIVDENDNILYTNLNIRTILKPLEDFDYEISIIKPTVNWIFSRKDYKNYIPEMSRNNQRVFFGKNFYISGFFYKVKYREIIYHIAMNIAIDKKVKITSQVRELFGHLKVNEVYLIRNDFSFFLKKKYCLNNNFFNIMKYMKKYK